MLITPLHLAVQKGDGAEIRKLTDAGVDVNARDANGSTPLKYASCEGRAEILTLLLSLGADPRLADKKGFTPLHCVAAHGFHDESLEMARTLIRAGADPNSRSAEHGFVPLHEVRTVAMVSLLISCGADPKIKNERGQTPAEYLHEEGHPLESIYLR